MFTLYIFIPQNLKKNIFKILGNISAEWDQFIDTLVYEAK